jgi:hypothetical protein
MGMRIEISGQRIVLETSSPLPVSFGRDSAYEPGPPELPLGLPAARITSNRILRDVRVTARSILGGLHHEHRLEKLAA